MSAHTKLRRLITELLAEDGIDQEFSDSESLILSGLLDSLAVVQIIVFMESAFDIDFSDIYFDQGGFDSIELMLDFLHKHRT
jgi:acyl carrier protein